jgi:hypothetical protein
MKKQQHENCYLYFFPRQVSVVSANKMLGTNIRFLFDTNKEKVGIKKAYTTHLYAIIE